MKKKERQVRVFLGIFLIILSGFWIVELVSEGLADNADLIALLGIYSIGAISVCWNCMEK